MVSDSCAKVPGFAAGAFGGARFALARHDRDRLRQRREPYLLGEIVGSRQVAIILDERTAEIGEHRRVSAFDDALDIQPRLEEGQIRYGFPVSVLVAER